MFVKSEMKIKGKYVNPNSIEGTQKYKPHGMKDNYYRPGSKYFLQRYLGNGYMQSSGNVPIIQKKCDCGGTCSSCYEEEEKMGVQVKLKIGEPDDVYEREADRVAERVMRMSGWSLKSENGRPSVGASIQRISSAESGFPESTTDIHLNQRGGHCLSQSTRGFMEPRFGVDFGDVRLHSDSDAHQTASRINARAFTYGSHIWMGKGESEQNQKLMAHELTHVVQQNKNSTVPYIQCWSYGVGSHVTSGGNTLREVTDPDEREGANGMDAAMALVDSLVNGTNWRARNCQQWFDDNCVDPRTLSDLHSRAVIWMWREADGSSGNGLTDGGNGVHHAVTEQLFRIRSRYALAATILHEYWHDCDTGAPADIGDDAKAACGLPNI